jgi:hypothetical protein
MELRDKEDERAVLRYGLALVGAARIKLPQALWYDGPERAAWMVPLAIAEIARVALDELDAAGGDSAAVLESIGLSVAGGRTEGAGHG